MESNFNNRDFEQIVKRNADQYRMIPSDKVWKGISSALHTRRRWYGIGLVSLLLLTSVSVTWIMVSDPGSKKQDLNTAQNTEANTTNPADQSTKLAENSVTNDLNNVLSFNKVKHKERAALNNINQLSTEILTTSGNSTEFLIAENSHVNADLPLTMERAIKNTPEKTETPAPYTYFKLGNSQEPANSIALDEKLVPGKTAVRSENRIPLYKEPYSPLTIESVVNAYQPKKMHRKLSWQLYFTPTISYRKLRENKSYQGTSPFDPANYPFASLTDINKAVTHKPDLGLELGFATRYPLTKNLKLRGGLQFNINRYDIKAFVYNGEQATINLSGGNGTNSVTAWTYYRNYNGYKSDWLKNFYFSVSAPIGAELKILGNDKTNFGIAGTIQPTYIISDRAYLISTDYKNYAEVPWLIRHVNVNTSFETFISYTKRNTRWQVGPQVRYQVLSSFQNKYPVKENLFDFGLKIGVTLNQ